MNSAFQLKYSVKKLEEEFEIYFGAAVCKNNGECYYDVTLINNYRVPIPECSSNFSFSLPGMTSQIVIKSKEQHRA